MKALVIKQVGEERSYKVQTSLRNIPIPKITENSKQVLIKVHYSSINFKDALAVTGMGKILRKPELIGGVDLVGVVVDSASSQFKKGDQVLCTGQGIGEDKDGGYAEYAVLEEEHLTFIPQKLSLKEAIILGTAGFTAGLCLHRMEQNGQTPDKGPILINGATGGVGSFACVLFSSRGYRVWATSGRIKKHGAFLEGLGVEKLVEPADIPEKVRPLEAATLGGAIDNLGGGYLEAMIPKVHLWGNIALVGLASDHQFQTTVMPMILRGVSLLGISSNNCPRAVRSQIWDSFGGKWQIPDLENFVSKEITLEQVVETAEDLLDRKLFGRVIVEINP